MEILKKKGDSYEKLDGIHRKRENNKFEYKRKKEFKGKIIKILSIHCLLKRLTK